MDDSPARRPNRYDVSGNMEAEYVDADGKVLVNKAGISDLGTLQIREEEALAAAYEVLLGEVRSDTRMTCELIRHVHGRIFGELYEWAGRWRTVWISKPGITWPAPDFIGKNMQLFEDTVLRKYSLESIRESQAFCTAVGEIQGEFLVVHPFREGNARTIKLVTDLLAAQTGRPPLVYDQTDEGTRRYIQAAQAAFKRDHAPITEIIRQALEEARK